MNLHSCICYLSLILEAVCHCNYIGMFQFAQKLYLLKNSLLLAAIDQFILFIYFDCKLSRGLFISPDSHSRSGSTSQNFLQINEPSHPLLILEHHVIFFVVYRLLFIGFSRPYHIMNILRYIIGLLYLSTIRLDIIIFSKCWCFGMRRARQGISSSCHVFSFCVDRYRSRFILRLAL